MRSNGACGRGRGIGIRGIIRRIAWFGLVLLDMIIRVGSELGGWGLKREYIRFWCFLD